MSASKINREKAACPRGSNSRARGAMCVWLRWPPGHQTLRDTKQFAWNKRRDMQLTVVTGEWRTRRRWAWTVDVEGLPVVPGLGEEVEEEQHVVGSAMERSALVLSP